MTAAHRRANVLTIAPGVPFLPTFAEALLTGRVVPGLSRDAEPFALARTTIFVPTQRARRALLTAIAGAAGGTTLLPRVAALGALDEAEPIVGDDTALGHAADALPAIDDLERRLTLTRFVLAWAKQLRGAIVAVDPASGIVVDELRALLVGTSPADAFALAGELGRLIDEFIIEGIDKSLLRDLAGAEHDRYWQITARFLAIAFEMWPAHLGESGRIDAAERRVHLLEAETARLHGSDSVDPVIVVGSTGTNEATAKLMAAICRLPNGAVVLPGLDTTMPDDVFARVGQAEDETDEPAYSHPQAALKRLLTLLGVERGSVEELAPAGNTSRVRLVSEALRPAEATDAWPHVRSTYGASLASAFERVDFLEAADEREEALAIAVRLREILETPGQTAALITPDRTLARRVRSELARWSVAIEDSAGEPLSATPSGILARLVLDAAEKGTDAALLALLSHPAAAFGHARETVAHLARVLEVGVFRAGHTAASASAAERIAKARENARDRRAHPAARRITSADWHAAEALLQRTGDALARLRTLEGRSPLSTWVEAHREVVFHVAAPLAEDEHGALLALFEEPALRNPSLALGVAEYRAMYERLAESRVVHATGLANPRLTILGLLEARLLSADVVILGGLDETIWPPIARGDAFLNRPMRTKLGLTPPERRIGQTAHDFWMAMGASSVLLTRAKKRGGSPTTPSRFLQRLTALTGAALNDARARGAVWARYARTLDAPRGFMPIATPQPKPPLALRPTQLSVTRIEMWIRDPYAIYAEFILKLSELGDLDPEPGFAEQGTAIHAAIDWATKAFGVAPLPDDAGAHLAQKATDLLRALESDATWRHFRRPRLLGGLAFFLGYHASRQPGLAAVLTERSGRLVLPLADGTTFTLTGTADRIEVARDGAIRIVDFKTGTPPSNEEIAANLAPQLTLEAVMVARGGFDDVPSRDVTDAYYIKLGGKTGGEEKKLQFEDRSFNDVVAEHATLLLELANTYRNPDQGYASRPIAKWAMRYARYDHLARVKEWSATSGAEADIA